MMILETEHTFVGHVVRAPPHRAVGRELDRVGAARTVERDRIAEDRRLADLDHAAVVQIDPAHHEVLLLVDPVGRGPVVLGAHLDVALLGDRSVAVKRDDLARLVVDPAAVDVAEKYELVVGRVGHDHVRQLLRGGGRARGDGKDGDGPGTQDAGGLHELSPGVGCAPP